MEEKYAEGISMFLFELNDFNRGCCPVLVQLGTVDAHGVVHDDVITVRRCSAKSFAAMAEWCRVHNVYLDVCNGGVRLSFAAWTAKKREA